MLFVKRNFSEPAEPVSKTRREKEMEKGTAFSSLPNDTDLQRTVLDSPASLRPRAREH